MTSWWDRLLGHTPRLAPPPKEASREIIELEKRSRKQVVEAKNLIKELRRLEKLTNPRK